MSHSLLPLRVTWPHYGCLRVAQHSISSTYLVEIPMSCGQKTTEIMWTYILIVLRVPNPFLSNDIFFSVKPNFPRKNKSSEEGQLPVECLVKEKLNQKVYTFICLFLQRYCQDMQIDNIEYFTLTSLPFTRPIASVKINWQVRISRNHRVF